ncbi:hypothetical protein HMPREF3033_00924 [Veillonellaceae bacterium DNF00751]|nr:hypothetical protein HMPREF3033_00924 [Veillonellaceae bacterium DNF00751]
MLCIYSIIYENCYQYILFPIKKLPPKSRTAATNKFADDFAPLAGVFPASLS